MTSMNVTSDGNVTALRHREGPMAQSMVSDVIRYWDGLRHGRDVPARGDLDPRAFQAALSHTFVADRARPGTVRFRLSGRHLTDLMGMEVRGMPVRAFFELSDRKRLMENVESVFCTPAALDVDMISDTQHSQPLAGRMLLLPLRGQDSAINRALGLIVTEGEIGLPPRRFRIRRMALTPLLAGQPLGGPANAAATPGLAEPAAEFAEPRPARPAGKPRLRLVEGGRK